MASVCLGVDMAFRSHFEMSCFRWNNRGGGNGQIHLDESYSDLGNPRDPSWHLSPVSLHPFPAIRWPARVAGNDRLGPQILHLRSNVPGAP